MNGQLVRAAVALTRLWARIYTTGMPAEAGEDRRADIESDVWEFLHDEDRDRSLTPALVVLGRLLLGVPDDLAWRIERARDADPRTMPRVVAVAATILLLVTVCWLLPASSGTPKPRRATACADAQPEPLSTADLRLSVMQCAGAFFQPTGNVR
jgi:hypothetical protein